METKPHSNFPLDLAGLFGVYVILLPLVAVGSRILMSVINAGETGDITWLWIAIALGCIGIVLLFLARLPLYRDGRFIQFGPRGLDDKHRQLYGWAWCFIGTSIGLLALLSLPLIWMGIAGI